MESPETYLSMNGICSSCGARCKQRQFAPCFDECVQEPSLEFLREESHEEKSKYRPEGHGRGPLVVAVTPECHSRDSLCSHRRHGPVITTEITTIKSKHISRPINKRLLASCLCNEVPFINWLEVVTVNSVYNITFLIIHS
jgi:hypothetical protein